MMKTDEEPIYILDEISRNALICNRHIKNRRPIEDKYLAMQARILLTGLMRLLEE